MEKLEKAIEEIRIAIMHAKGGLSAYYIVPKKLIVAREYDLSGWFAVKDYYTLKIGG